MHNWHGDTVRTLKVKRLDDIYGQHFKSSIIQTMQ